MTGSLRPSLLAVALALVALVAGPAAAQAFTARGSARQVYATAVPAGARVTLLSPTGRTLGTRRATAQGDALFRKVTPGAGYRVRVRGSTSGRLTVLSTRAAPPSTRVYNQTLPSSGYGYLTTRDGTKLAISVRPPQSLASQLTGVGLDLPPVPAGPSPTLIEYSGYGYADPKAPQSGIAALANILGFTVVDVNMRGTGCSGGAFDFFEPLQNLDGYDVIETVARQRWVAHHKGGMLGISYGGISQLSPAQLDPPSLAAISPLSVIDQTQTTLYPGGILNTGFALNWAKERVHDAKPASATGGQPWAYHRIQGGDATCRSDQALHGEAIDLLKKIKANDHYVPSVADPLSPISFVHKIKAPTFLACQWTDEQTGGHCPTLASRLTGARRKWVTFTNGTHVDSLAPDTFNRLVDFLTLYVARQAPITRAALVQAAGPAIYHEAMGIDRVTMPPDPIQAQPTYAGARASFEKLPALRVLFDNGAGGTAPGQPKPAYAKNFSRFPVPGTVARSWYLGAGGKLGARPARAAADSFTWSPRARPRTDFRGPTDSSPGGIWTATPPYDWRKPARGTAASYVSAPLSRNTTVLGAGSVTAWVRSSRANVDLQATLTEVRPDGKETFVQGGWLRANERKLDRAKSTSLAPVLSLRKRDVRSMPIGRFVKVTIPLYYEGHAFRRRSRLRIYITAPNGDQPIWSFSQASPRSGGARVAIGHGPKTPSRLLLPVVPGLSIPSALPPCPGLRGEPCRTYRRYANRAATLAGAPGTSMGPRRPRFTG